MRAPRAVKVVYNADGTSFEATPPNLVCLGGRSFRKAWPEVPSSSSSFFPLELGLCLNDLAWKGCKWTLGVVVLKSSQGQASSCQLMFGTNRLCACTTLRPFPHSLCVCHTLLRPSLAHCPAFYHSILFCIRPTHPSSLSRFTFRVESFRHVSKGVWVTATQ